MPGALRRLAQGRLEPPDPCGTPPGRRSLAASFVGRPRGQGAGLGKRDNRRLSPPRRPRHAQGHPRDGLQFPEGGPKGTRVAATSWSKAAMLASGGSTWAAMVAATAPWCAPKQATKTSPPGRHLEPQLGRGHGCQHGRVSLAGELAVQSTWTVRRPFSRWSNPQLLV